MKGISKTYTRLFLYGMLMIVISCKKNEEVNFLGIRTFPSGSAVYLESYGNAGMVVNTNSLHFFIHSSDPKNNSDSYLKNLVSVEYTPGLNKVSESRPEYVDTSISIEGRVIFIEERNLYLAVARDLTRKDDSLINLTRKGIQSFVLFDERGTVLQNLKLPSKQYDCSIKSVKVLANGDYVIFVLDNIGKTSWLYYLDKDFKYQYRLRPTPVEYNFNETLRGIEAGEESFYLLINSTEGSSRFFRIVECSYDGESRERYSSQGNNEVGLTLKRNENQLLILSRSYPDTKKTSITLFDENWKREELDLLDEEIQGSYEHIFWGESLAGMENNFEHIFSNIVYRDLHYYFTVKVFANSKITTPHDQIAFVKNKFVRTDSKFRLETVTTFDQAAHNNFNSYNYLAPAGLNFIHISSPFYGGNLLNFIQLDGNGEIVK